MSKKLIGSLKQMLALFLCVTMIAQILPARVYAEAISTSDMTASEQESLEVLGEDITRRTEDTKHFRLKGGGYVMMKYGNAVHYQDSTGQWQDIDNTLERIDGDAVLMTNSAETISSGYVNRSNGIEVRFADNLADGTIYQYREGNYSMVMALAPAVDEITPIHPGLDVMNTGTVSPTATENSSGTELEPVEPIYSTATASVMTDPETTAMTFKS